MITEKSRFAVLNHIATDKLYRNAVSERLKLSDTILNKAKTLTTAGGETFEVTQASAVVGGDITEITKAAREGVEIPKYYALNDSGNIMVSSTAKSEADMSDDVKQTFQKVAVFFAAWTAALAKKEKNLQDYDALSTIISKSGFFVKMHEEDRTFSHASADVTLDTAVIDSVLSGFASMGATAGLKIAQTVLGAIGSELKVTAKMDNKDKRVGHLLFVCENLLGMPIVTALLFNTTATEAESVTKSNCHQTVTEEVNMTYHQDTFMFVDPSFINKFTKEFKSNPEFDKLIDRLASFVI